MPDIIITDCSEKTPQRPEFLGQGEDFNLNNLDIDLNGGINKKEKSQLKDSKIHDFKEKETVLTKSKYAFEENPFTSKKIIAPKFNLLNSINFNITNDKKINENDKTTLNITGIPFEGLKM